MIEFILFSSFDRERPSRPSLDPLEIIRRENRPLKATITEANRKVNRIFGGIRVGTRIWEGEPPGEPHYDVCNH
jgi:hypothetical protein